jgi:hypothetical protein
MLVLSILIHNNVNNNYTQLFSLFFFLHITKENGCENHSAYHHPCPLGTEYKMDHYDESMEDPAVSSIVTLQTDIRTMISDIKDLSTITTTSISTVTTTTTADLDNADKMSRHTENKTHAQPPNTGNDVLLTVYRDVDNTNNNTTTKSTSIVSRVIHLSLNGLHSKYKSKLLPCLLCMFTVLSSISWGMTTGCISPLQEYYQISNNFIVKSLRFSYYWIYLLIGYPSVIRGLTKNASRGQLILFIACMNVGGFFLQRLYVQPFGFPMLVAGNVLLSFAKPLIMSNVIILSDQYSTDNNDSISSSDNAHGTQMNHSSASSSEADKTSMRTAHGPQNNSKMIGLFLTLDDTLSNVTYVLSSTYLKNLNDTKRWLDLILDVTFVISIIGFFASLYYYIREHSLSESDTALLMMIDENEEDRTSMCNAHNGPQTNGGTSVAATTSSTSLPSDASSTSNKTKQIITEKLSLIKCGLFMLACGTSMASSTLLSAVLDSLFTGSTLENQRQSNEQIVLSYVAIISITLASIPIPSLVGLILDRLRIWNGLPLVLILCQWITQMGMMFVTYNAETIILWIVLFSLIENALNMTFMISITHMYPQLNRSSVNTYICWCSALLVSISTTTVNQTAIEITSITSQDYINSLGPMMATMTGVALLAIIVTTCMYMFDESMSRPHSPTLPLAPQ